MIRFVVVALGVEILPAEMTFEDKFDPTVIEPVMTSVLALKVLTIAFVTVACVA